MKNNLFIIRNVDVPKKIFQQKCLEALKDRNLTAVAEESGVPINSLLQFKHKGHLGEDKRNTLAQYLFNKAWMEVVTDRPTPAETTQEMDMRDEIRKLWIAYGNLEERVKQLTEERTRPPMGQGRTGR